MEIIFTSFIISIVIQAFFFAIAATFKTDKVTDLSYGLGFILLMVYILFSNSSVGVVQSSVALLIIAWGIRLITYLFRRILVTGKDKRFDGIRENFWKFFQFWFIQAIAVWVISIPAIITVSKPSPLNISVFYFIGIFVWLTGITIESIADSQKFIFKSDPNNKDKWIESGIWKYSRHPNYFGEIICWWGIYIITLPHLEKLEHLAIAGPLFITSLLLFVSGIPPLEKKYNERYKNNPKYQDYKKRTSILVPLPNKEIF